MIPVALNIWQKQCHERNLVPADLSQGSKEKNNQGSQSNIILNSASVLKFWKISHVQVFYIQQKYIQSPYQRKMTFIKPFSLKIKPTLVAQTVKNPPAMWETWVRSLGWEEPLEKGTPNHYSILAREFHEQRSLAEYNPWGHKETDTAE